MEPKSRELTAPDPQPTEEPFLLGALRSPARLLDRLILAVVLGPPRSLEGRLRRRPGARWRRGRG
jgi:hypothetical protein